MAFLNTLAFPSELRLRVFEYSVLRKLFGPERVELTAQWRGPYNGNLYYCVEVQIPENWQRYETPNELGIS
jgi:hypothetical protein